MTPSSEVHGPPTSSTSFQPLQPCELTKASRSSQLVIDGAVEAARQTANRSVWGPLTSLPMAVFGPTSYYLYHCGTGGAHPRSRSS